MKLTDERVKFRSAHQRLRRGRELYVFLVRFHIHSTEDLHRAATRMKAGGLYAESTLDKDVQWSILRKLWKQWCASRDMAWYDQRGPVTFCQWLAERGWHQPRYGGGWKRTVGVRRVA